MRKWGEHGGLLPTLNHLIALEATARLGSFRAAADEMNLTQGAVAQQVRALEKELGGQLFRRLPRGLSPNSKGQGYINRLQLALGIIEEATRDALGDSAKKDENQIILSTTPSFASRWLIPRLPRLNAAHPSISLMIDASEMVRTFRGDGRIDMAIRWGYPPFSEGHSRFLFPGRAIPVCSPELLGQRGKLKLNELLELPLISDSHDNWGSWFEAYGGITDRVSGPNFSQSSHALEAAEQGMGVALVPGLLAESGIKAGALVRALDSQYQLETDAAFYIITAEPYLPNSLGGKVTEWLLHEANEVPEL